MKILKVLIILFIIIFLIAVALSIYAPDCLHDIAKAIRLKILPSSIFNNNSVL
ncbi:hypothetical protein [Fusobacterium sp.]|uniref:hypothetical protein n=1 Tax=Fusobacterium sp. TaxID=68766 RepID=UPI0029046AE4|nr:hypothetical protein [Fusobacterium sp.]MDU1910439.1 hypothetical protein [Fusobacterium sp.]